MTTQSLPASLTSEPSAVERRASARYPLVQRCFIRPPGANGLEDWRGIAYNISEQGVGVALAYQLLPGAMLLITPPDLKNAPPIRARVVHVKLVDFLWFHGCELLEPLDESGLKAWLRQG